MAKQTKQARRFTECTRPRRWLERRWLLNIETGKHEPDGEQWKEGPCGKPLFGADEQASGICRSCARGWTHPENYPLD